MKSNIDSIVNWIKKNKITYFRIYYPNSKDIALKFPTESDSAAEKESSKNYTYDDALLYFKESVDDLQLGTYEIKGRAKQADTNGELKNFLVIGHSDSFVSSKNVDANIGVITELQETVNQLKYENKLRDIKDSYKSELDRKEAENQKLKRILASKKSENPMLNMLLPLLMQGGNNPLLSMLQGQSQTQAQKRHQGGRSLIDCRISKAHTAWRTKSIRITSI